MNELVTRLDFGTLSNAQRTPQGGLRVPAALTRAGIFAYLRADGSVLREYRPAEEVFRAESLGSLRGATVTRGHPKELVDARTWRETAIGHVADDVRQDGTLVAAEVVVQDADAVVAIEHGELAEVSCGYRCRIDATAGEFEGQPYDVVQRDIAYNHCALGPRGWGRAGRDVALRLDSGDAVMTSECAPATPTASAAQRSAAAPLNEERKDMAKTIRIDDIEYEVGSEAHLQAQARSDQRRDTRVKELEAETETLRGRLDAAERQLSETRAELERANDPKRVDALVAARVALVSDARKLLGDEAKLDGLSDRDVRALALSKVDPEPSLDGRSDEYVRGMFEQALKNASAPPAGSGQSGAGGERNDSLARARQAAVSAPTNNERTDAMEVRRKSVEESRGRWREPLAISKDRRSDHTTH